MRLWSMALLSRQPYEVLFSFHNSNNCLCLSFFGFWHSVVAFLILTFNCFKVLTVEIFLLEWLRSDADLSSSFELLAFFLTESLWFKVFELYVRMWLCHYSSTAFMNSTWWLKDLYSPSGSAVAAFADCDGTRSKTEFMRWLHVLCLFIVLISAFIVIVSE